MWHSLALAKRTQRLLQDIDRLPGEFGGVSIDVCVYAAVTVTRVVARLEIRLARYQVERLRLFASMKWYVCRRQPPL